MTWSYSMFARHCLVLAFVLSTPVYGQDETPGELAVTANIKAAAKAAFASSHDGLSCDEVILDTEIQARFQQACLTLAPGETAEQFNWALLNLRKAGELNELPTTRTRRVLLDDVRPIAEIAARSIQDKHNVSIDRIMCNPQFREEFDRSAQQILPSADLYRVRKSAFQLRKTRRLRPELITRIADWGRVISTFEVGELRQNLDFVPPEPGIYIFRDASGYLYIGEAADLRRRLKEHLDESDRVALANYLADQADNTVTVELHTFAPGSRISQLVVRRAYESELIRSRNPRFNIRP